MWKSQKLSHVIFLKGISIAIGSVMSVDRAEKPLKSLWISISCGTIQDMLTKAAKQLYRKKYYTESCLRSEV